ncbi:MAG: ATP-binding cassette domain-containing protein [Nitrospirae bacterium]|nr:ATP-binding cassette domain-containing protein [Nitrospirota bacterium]
MGLQLRISDVWKSYDGCPILQGTSFTFDASGVYVLMGDNGTGKSTFLRICALLEKQDRGTVSYLSDGQVLPHDIALRRRVTLVLPKIGIFNKTVFDNVAYGLKLRGFEKEAVRDRVEKAVDFVGLRPKMKQPALTLSSGETQRMGIARALAINPEMLFLDEPAAFVDVKNRDIIEEVIVNLGREGETTVVLTTHDRAQAGRLSERLMVLENGLIRAD